MRTYKDIKRLQILTDVPAVKGWVVEMVMRDKSSPTGVRSAMLTVDYGQDFLETVFKSIQLQLETGDKWREDDLR